MILRIRSAGLEHSGRKEYILKSIKSNVPTIFWNQNSRLRCNVPTNVLNFEDLEKRIQIPPNLAITPTNYKKINIPTSFPGFSCKMEQAQ